MCFLIYNINSYRIVIIELDLYFGKMIYENYVIFILFVRINFKLIICEIF